MSYETINVAPVTPRIGAEVDGLTLAKPLSNRQVEELHQALAEHQVLFFRDQPLDVESHKALGRCFGELHIHPNTPGPEGASRDPSHPCRRQFQAHCRGILAFRRLM
jgi:taurine dioxygenase